jgi:hypothetical protein
VQAGALAWHWVARLLTGPPRSPVPPRQARPCTHARTPPRPRTPITRALPRVTGKGGRALPLTLYLAQLGLNLAWTPLFFQKHWSDAALADSVGAWRRCAACSCVCGAATPPCSHSLFCHGHTQPDTPLPPTHTRAHTHTHTHTHTRTHTHSDTTTAMLGVATAATVKMADKAGGKVRRARARAWCQVLWWVGAACRRPRAAVVRAPHAAAGCHEHCFRSPCGDPTATDAARATNTQRAATHTMHS